MTLFYKMIRNGSKCFSLTFIFWLLVIKYQTLTYNNLMNRKINTGEVYIPSNAKNHTYYPIEITKSTPEQSFERPPQATIRIQKYRQKQVDSLRRANQQMKEREEVYIDKLMKLQEGLQNQHSQFIKLQELYTQLFESYKQKQSEIAQRMLTFKYRETQRYHNFDRPQDSKSVRERQDTEESKQTFASKNQDLTIRQSDWLNKQRKWKVRESELVMMNENLTDKLMKMNEKFQKLVHDGSHSRNKDKMMQSRANVNQQKIIEELQQSHRQITIQKQARLKYQYENQFLKNRSKDLEDQRLELQKLLVYKQKEIAKLREEKIRIHRQSSQKMMSRSPSQNNRAALKTLLPVNNGRTQERQKQVQNASNEDSLSYQNSKNSQYFSFSRERKDISLEEELPNFPPELEIDALISQHKQQTL